MCHRNVVKGQKALHYETFNKVNNNCFLSPTTSKCEGDKFPTTMPSQSLTWKVTIGNTRNNKTTTAIKSPFQHEYS